MNQKPHGYFPWILFPGGPVSGLQRHQGTGHHLNIG